jgi:hypothetical protein
MISVGVATILIYPVFFLYTNDFSNGASNLPHHVWTVAQPVEYKASVEPDVIMRSIWVHGSYMRALDREILLGALMLQDELLGPTPHFSPRQPGGRRPQLLPGAELTLVERDAFHVVNGLTNQSWFFHSPLQYWSCSPDIISADAGIISTVNQKKTQPTSVNVTLRHSIVFSGKRFEERKLLAADALVITLIHLRDSPVGRQWERKAEALADRAKDEWTLYPSDGRSMSSQLYEFQFRPISTQDSIVLALAYGLAFIYLLMSLSKLRAVKSKFGLIVTVLAQTAACILSSFTVCAIFSVDLSRIPQAAYPIVVVSMSLENVFRLINTVIQTRSEDSTTSRIGQAFGETAHIALASTTQNLFILWGLSKAVSPGVSPLCTFIGIATVFDFFYLSTFFLSVLSVDVRRTELSDALANASLRFNRPNPEPQQRTNWIDAMLQGKVAISTRIAGTIVMIGAVLIAHWHFFENETMFNALSRLFRPSGAKELASSKPSLLVDIHQARSPTSWLRLQDHETAREVIHVIKPWAHSYIARVYEPLIFVKRGADRMPHVKEGALLPAVYDFLDHRLTPFFFTVAITIAGVLLLTNYLLWDEAAEFGSDDGDGRSEPLLHVLSLPGGHSLDVVLMSASLDGHVVSVGLDRLIRVWDARFGMRSYAINDMERPDEDPFPVLAMTIDGDSTWLALLSHYRVLLWNLVEQRWGPSFPIDLYGQKPEAFFFGSPRLEYIFPLIMVRRNGTAVQIWPDVGEPTDTVICNEPLLCARPLILKRTQTGADSFLIFLADLFL